MKTKNYKPLTFTLGRDDWKALGRLLGGNIRDDIAHKQSFNPHKLDFFQTDMEKIMFSLDGTGYHRTKDALQMEINKHRDNGDWV